MSGPGPSTIPSAPGEPKPAEGILAVLLLGHGSKAPGANEGMYALVRKLRRKWPSRLVEASFLEINHPSIPEGIDLCVDRGAGRVILVPYFLHLGNHVGKDIPPLVAQARSRHPEVEMALAPHLGFHPLLAEIVEDRIEEALSLP